MKKIMNRFRNILLENRLLSIFLAGFAVVAFLLLWECSMEGILREIKTACDAEHVYWLNAETELYGG